MAYLVLVRHGETDWNVLKRFSGQTDVPLSAAGIAQAKAVAQELRDIELHAAHSSQLERARHTLRHILDTLGQAALPTTAHAALNERNYGAYEGQTHSELTQQIGKPAVRRVRRAWDQPIPGGESLKQVHERVVPYYIEHILADLKDGKNVIVSSHSGTLRALVKYLENISESDVEQLELGNGEVRIYEIGDEGELLTTQIRHAKNQS